MIYRYKNIFVVITENDLRKPSTTNPLVYNYLKVYNNNKYDF